MITSRPTPASPQLEKKIGHRKTNTLDSVLLGIRKASVFVLLGGLDWTISSYTVNTYLAKTKNFKVFSYVLESPL